MKFNFIDNENSYSAKIKIIGVGGAGGNAINNMIASKLKGVEFIAANTDSQDLERIACSNKLQMGSNISKGLGSGADPELGRLAAEESIYDIREAVSGSDIVFLIAGMGGGTGTGASPIIARECKRSGALTVAVVTKPFLFEGEKRMNRALEGIDILKKDVDTMIIIPNECVKAIGDKGAMFRELIAKADNVLLNAVKGISDLIMSSGFINLDFADVKTVMFEMGTAIMGTGKARGSNRASVATQQAINSPFLEDISIREAKGLLMNITAPPNITMEEIDQASNYVKGEIDEDAEIFWGVVFDETMGDEVQVTIIATGIDRPQHRGDGKLRDMTPDEAKEAWTIKVKGGSVDELDLPVYQREKIRLAHPKEFEEVEDLEKPKKGILKKIFFKDNLDSPTFLKKMENSDRLQEIEETIDGENIWHKGYQLFISTSDANERSFKLKQYRNQILHIDPQNPDVGFVNALWRLSEDINTVPDYSDNMQSLLRKTSKENIPTDLQNYYSFISLACHIRNAQDFAEIISHEIVTNMHSEEKHPIVRIPTQIIRLVETIDILSDNSQNSSNYNRLKIVKAQLIELNNSCKIEVQTPEIICFHYVIKRYLNLVLEAFAMSLRSLNIDSSSVPPIFINRWNNVRFKINEGPRGESFNLSIKPSLEYIAEANNESYMFSDTGTIIDINMKPFCPGTIQVLLQLDDITFYASVIVLIDNPFIVGVPIQTEDMFVGREDAINRIFRGIISPQPNNFLITGRRRVGKTSLLYAIKRKLPKGALPVFLSTEVCGIHSADICKTLTMEVFKSLQKNELIDHESIPYPDVAIDNPISSVIGWFELLHEKYFSSSMFCIVILIDEASAIISWDQEIQNLLRYLFSNMNWIRGILAGPLDIIKRMRDDISSPLYNIFSTEKLGPITKKDASALLSPTIKRLGLADIENVMDQLYDYTGGLPYYIQAIGYELIENYYSQKISGKELLDKTIGQVRKKLETSYPATLMKLSPDEKIAICLISKNINPPDASALKLASADFVEKREGTWIINPKIEREWVNDFMDTLLDDASKKIWASHGKNIDLKLLAKDLKKLRDRSGGSIEIDDALRNALQAADEGNGVKAVKYLSKVGQWTLDSATKIGTDVAAAAIKAIYGIN
jgi:cell division protein FtsZ